MKRKRENIYKLTHISWIFIVYSSNLLASLSGIIALGFGDAAVSLFYLFMSSCKGSKKGNMKENLFNRFII